MRTWRDDEAILLLLSNSFIATSPPANIFSKPMNFIQRYSQRFQSQSATQRFNPGTTEALKDMISLIKLLGGLLFFRRIDQALNPQGLGSEVQQQPHMKS